MPVNRILTPPESRMATPLQFGETEGLDVVLFRRFNDVDTFPIGFGVHGPNRV